VSQTTLSHTRENVEVEEVHQAENQEHQSHLRAQDLDRLGEILRLVPFLQRESDEADVDQVEPDDEEVVDGVRERPRKLSTRKIRPFL